MFLVLLFTMLGFIVGLGYVMKKRSLRPGKLLAAAFLGLLSVGIIKVFRDNYKRNRRW